MEKINLLNTIKSVRNNSKKRNFVQSFDLIINLKNINLKKPEESVDLSLNLPNEIGEKIKICALVDKELAEKAEIFDKVIKKDDFGKYKDKKILGKLASDYDVFIAQANIMSDVAKTFGKTLGSKGKMPDPKASGIIAPTANLEAVKKKLQNLIKLKTKNEAVVKVKVGNERLDDEKISENVLAIYNAVIHALPQEELNVKDVMLKLTMGHAVKIEKKKAKEEKDVKKKEK